MCECACSVCRDTLHTIVYFGCVHTARKCVYMALCTTGSVCTSEVYVCVCTHLRVSTSRSDADAYLNCVACFVALVKYSS